MPNNHHITAALLCGAVLLCGTGCTTTQVRDRAYLQAIELQTPDTPTVQLHGFQTEKEVSSGSGATLSEAIANAAVPLGKDLFLGHLELIASADPVYGTQLNQLMQDYRLSPACKVIGLSDGAALSEMDTSGLVQRLRQAEQLGKLPETDLFTILREWDSASGTALLPLTDTHTFSAAVATKEKIITDLSDDAVTGLCWLRGDNVPQQITASNGKTYVVASAKTQLSAEKEQERIRVTVTIKLHGNGELTAAAEEIRRVCQTAIRETVTEHHADVFDLEACLWSQCYDFMAQHDWDSAAELLDFSFQCA